MPRTLVIPVATSPRSAPPPGGEGLQATHQDRETCIMSGMDGEATPVPELMAEIKASRVSATLEGTSA